MTFRAAVIGAVSAFTDAFDQTQYEFGPRKLRSLSISDSEETGSHRNLRLVENTGDDITHIQSLEARSNAAYQFALDLAEAAENHVLNTGEHDMVAETEATKAANAAWDAWRALEDVAEFNVEVGPEPAQFILNLEEFHYKLQTEARFNAAYQLAFDLAVAAVNHVHNTGEYDMVAESELTKAATIARDALLEFKVALGFNQREEEIALEHFHVDLRKRALVQCLEAKYNAAYELALQLAVAADNHVHNTGEQDMDARTQAENAADVALGLLIEFNQEAGLSREQVKLALAKFHEGLEAAAMNIQRLETRFNDANELALQLVLAAAAHQHHNDGEQDTEAETQAEEAIDAARDALREFDVASGFNPEEVEMDLEHFRDDLARSVSNIFDAPP